MNLVTSWNPEFIQSLAARVQSYLDEMVYTEAFDFANEDGDVNLQEEEKTQEALENILVDDGLLGIVESNDFSNLVDVVFDAIPSKFFERITEGFEEQIEETNAYNKNPLAYYGMSERDFL